MLHNIFLTQFLFKKLFYAYLWWRQQARQVPCDRWPWPGCSCGRGLLPRPGSPVRCRTTPTWSPAGSASWAAPVAVQYHLMLPQPQLWSSSRKFAKFISIFEVGRVVYLGELLTLGIMDKICMIITCDDVEKFFAPFWTATAAAGFKVRENILISFSY